MGDFILCFDLWDLTPSLLGGKECPSLDLKTKHPPNWFEARFFKKVGACLQTSFWKDTWISSILFMNRFHRIFTISQR